MISYHKKNWSINSFRRFLWIILCMISFPIFSADNLKKKSDIFFILDASGSMWGQIEGKAKITIAKEVMQNLIPEISDENQIGLMAYGHRRKSDCSDVETLVKLGENNKKSILNSVMKLTAKGKTPLTRSVNQAFEQLKQQQKIATIILISDGIESCGGDPCAAVKAAKSGSIRFILHTVGFGLSSEESKQLQCMAKAGGGEFFQANNAVELLNSTRKAVKSNGTGALKLMLQSGGKPVNAWVRMRVSGTDETVVFTNDDGVEPGHLFLLPPGTYQLETLPAGLHGIDPMLLNNIKIESGKMLVKKLDFKQATLQVTALNNGEPAVVQIRVKNEATGKTVFDTSTYSTFTMRGVKTPYDVSLLPGKYLLMVTIPETSIEPFNKLIDLSSAGEQVNELVSFSSASMKIVAQINGKSAKAEINVRKAGEKHNVFETMPYVGAQTPLNLTFSSGLYDLYITPVGEQGFKQKVINNIVLKENSVKDMKVILQNILNNKKTKTRDNNENSIELNMDRPGGGDFRHIVPSSDDPVLCQQACQKDEHCKAWTYVKPNTIQGDKPNCWLKSSIPDAVANSCCVSGLKTIEH
ncbi:MAG TPA: VWA domain-containing protein [Aeromonadales bacterium]|nr:VWA domain-containing protein [Aeromonadales bacterium]